MLYRLFTKSARSSGPENIDRERPLSGHLAQVPVLGPSRITLENNGKFRPQPDRENAFAGATGGGDGPEIEPSLPFNTLILLTLNRVPVTSAANATELQLCAAIQKPSISQRSGCLSNRSDIHRY
jgi:hypothetical protein